MMRNLGGDHEGAIGPLERGLVITRLADIPFLFPLIAAPLGRAFALTEVNGQAVQNFAFNGNELRD